MHTATLTPAAMRARADVERNARRVALHASIARANAAAQHVGQATRRSQLEV